jgi:hypothetical protein
MLKRLSSLLLPLSQALSVPVQARMPRLQASKSAPPPLPLIPLLLLPVVLVQVVLAPIYLQWWMMR